MRYIFTFFLLLLYTAVFSQPATGKKNTSARDSGYQFRSVCLPVKNNVGPVYVIDGVISGVSEVKRIDPADIDSIYIIKEPQMKIFSCRMTERAAMIIVTRKSIERSIQIRDKVDAVPLIKATVSFISSDKRDTLMFVADSAGQVRTDELKRNKGWSVNVTSSGYRSFTGQLSCNKKQEILLERDFKTGPEAIIASAHVRRITCYFRYHLSDSLNDAEKPGEAGGLNIYPNPVKRGQQLNVRLTKGVFPDGLLKVLSSDGRLLMSVPVGAGKNQGLVQLSADQRWAAGIYLLQLVYANGRVGASEKIIIQ